MRSNMFVPTLCATLIAGLATGSIQAQGTGPITFSATEAAMGGTVICNGDPPTTLVLVDPSTSSGNGGLNEASASNFSANPCGLPLYSIQSVQDASYSADTNVSDVGNGGGELDQVSLLGGILTYQAKSEYDLCGASASGNTATINCQDTTQVQNLSFLGTPIIETLTQPQTINAADVQVQIPGYCVGAALFNGSLKLNSVVLRQTGNSGTIAIVPLELEGTLSCIGLPLRTETVDLQDEAVIEYEASSSIISAAITVAIQNAVSPNPTSFNPLTVANPSQ